MILATALFGLSIGYASADLWSPPSEGDLATDPNGTGCEAVMLFVMVKDVNPQEGTLTANFSSGGPSGVAVRATGIQAIHESEPSRQIEIVPSDPTVVDDIAPGAAIQVAGTVSDDGSMIEEAEIVVDYRDDGDRAYVIGTSLLEGLVAAGEDLRPR